MITGLSKSWRSLSNRPNFAFTSGGKSSVCASGDCGILYRIVIISLSSLQTARYGHFLFLTASFQRLDKVEVGTVNFFAAWDCGRLRYSVISIYLASCVADWITGACGSGSLVDCNEVEVGDGITDNPGRGCVSDILGCVESGRLTEVTVEVDGVVRCICWVVWMLSLGKSITVFIYGEV